MPRFHARVAIELSIGKCTLVSFFILKFLATFSFRTPIFSSNDVRFSKYDKSKLESKIVSMTFCNNITQHYALASLPYVILDEAGEQASKLKARLYGTALKVRPTTLGWVRLLGLRVSASRLATCVLHRLGTPTPGFAWHGSLANFFDFANEHRGNRFASPAQTGFKARGRWKGTSACKRGEEGETSDNPPSTNPCWKIVDDEIKAYVSRTFRAPSLYN